MKEELFSFVITFFSGWAWQSLGKVANPVTGKVEKNLDTAKHVIDIMEMLREKTQGNLTDSEKNFLDGTIAELQLNYVDELKKDNKEEDAKTDKGTTEKKTE
ncbi:MAG TPA: DUF1844 domain-containing protein [bacterium]|nr:DUF1844 domain-containing protein [bacterium]